MIALLVFSFLVMLYANFESADDFGQIGRKEDIDHTKQWLIRGAIVVGALLFFGKLWWAPGLAGLFSLEFRFQLNKVRGRHSFYVAPWSNFYNRVAYALVMSVKAGRPIWPTTLGLRATKDGYFSNQYHPVTDIHNTGKLLSCTEFVAFFGTVVLEFSF